MKPAANAKLDADLNGQIDEVRIWAGERTGRQIRENIFQDLTGREEGLVGRWNFNDGTIRPLAVDPAGNIWTVTSGAGLGRVRGTNAVQVAAVNTRADQAALHVAPDGALWFRNASGNRARFSRYDGRSVEHVPPSESGISSPVTVIHSDANGSLWLGDVKGEITRYDPVGPTFTRFDVDQSAEGFNRVTKSQFATLNSTSERLVPPGQSSRSYATGTISCGSLRN